MHLFPILAVVSVVFCNLGESAKSLWQRKVDSIKNFVTYPTKRDSMFRAAFFWFNNTEDSISWRTVSEQVSRFPRVHKICPMVVLTDFLSILANVSREMLLDEVDDVIIYNGGFHLVRISNVKRNSDVVAFVELTHYSSFLLRLAEEQSHQMSIFASVLHLIWENWLLFLLLPFAFYFAYRDYKLKWSHVSIAHRRQGMSYQSQST